MNQALATCVDVTPKSKSKMWCQQSQKTRVNVYEYSGGWPLITTAVLLDTVPKLSLPGNDVIEFRFIETNGNEYFPWFNFGKVLVETCLEITSESPTV